MSAFVLISDQTLTSPASSISASVETTYRKFRVSLFVVKDGTNGNINLQVNADGGANYSDQALMADNTTVAATRDTGQTSVRLTEAGALLASATALATVELEKPLATTPGRLTYQMANIGTGGSTAITLNTGSAQWSNTADLISSITVTASGGSLATGTRMLVEGAQP